MPRWLGDAEGMYCVYIPIHMKWPPVERLPIHPDEQIRMYDHAANSTDEAIVVRCMNLMYVAIHVTSHHRFGLYISKRVGRLTVKKESYK